MTSAQPAAVIVVRRLSSPEKCSVWSQREHAQTGRPLVRRLPQFGNAKKLLTSIHREEELAGKSPKRHVSNGI
jgi:hypothetical protein